MKYLLNRIAGWIYWKTINEKVVRKTYTRVKKKYEPILASGGTYQYCTRTECECALLHIPNREVDRIEKVYGNESYI